MSTSLGRQPAADPTDHAFAVLTRGSDLQYAPRYTATTSNVPQRATTDFPGAAPVFRPSGLTDGLLGPRYVAGGNSLVDPAAVRLVLAVIRAFDIFA